MFSIKELRIHGAYEIHPKVFSDSRGQFVKVFHRDAFNNLGLDVRFEEDYYSQSRRGVIRGLHFQKPPADHSKMVYCLSGKVFDVILDLRRSSPTYGHSIAINLSSDIRNIIYIPRGVAHGFCVLSDNATLIYKVSKVYDPKRDSGILWSSIGINWPESNPILSERDASFAPLSEFKSPFK